MGMEKFIDIVCRTGGIAPSAIVLVATVRALKHHGGLGRPTASRARRSAGGDRGRDREPRTATSASSREFGLPAVVAVNRRPEDTDEEVELVTQARRARPARSPPPSATGSPRAARGVAELAEAVVDGLRRSRTSSASSTRTASRSRRRSRRSPTRVYGASEVVYYLEAEHKIEQFTDQGLAELPVCMAKTPLSLSADPELLGAPSGFQLPVRDVRAYTGAGWLVPLCGDDPADARARQDRGGLRRRHRRRGPNRGAVLSAARRRPADERARRPQVREALAALASRASPRPPGSPRRSPAPRPRPWWSSPRGWPPIGWPSESRAPELTTEARLRALAARAG